MFCYSFRVFSFGTFHCLLSTVYFLICSLFTFTTDPPPPPPLPRNQIPPRDAFTIGSDEDTIQSCLQLIPQKPKKDYAKRLANEGHVLRYKCRMVTRNPVDGERVFVIKFYLEDDTIMIFEQMVPNLGVVGGKFRERALVKKPDHSRYTPLDFGVGKIVMISSYRFEMLSADHFTKVWTDAYNGGYPFVDPTPKLEGLGKAGIEDHFVRRRNEPLANSKESKK